MPAKKKPIDNAVEVDTAYLDKPVASLAGVAANRAAQLEKLGIRTVMDLVGHFPRDYEDWTTCFPIQELVHDEVCSFIACVRTAPSLQRKGRLSMLRASLSDESGVIRAIWFNQPYLVKKLMKGKFFFFRGRIRRDGKNFDVTNPVFEEIGDEVSDDAGNRGLQPVYPLTKGLTRGVLSSLIQRVLEKAIDGIADPLPAFIRKEEKLCGAAFAYEKIHKPMSAEEMEIARKRLVYEELFLVQGALRWMRMKTKKEEQAYPVLLSVEKKGVLEECIRRLPFSLTSDQQSISLKVLEDMRGAVPMNRLVQGDVGSGKTIIAAISMLACGLCGLQSVLMAPTSILAQQHYRTISTFLEGAGIRAALLLGSTSAAEKKRIRQELLSGEVSILVGTHAVLSKENSFSSLALLVTDEQHRFGVRQRGSFFEKGKTIPHVLVMSATPIPRTLALILYGDLDISVMREKPAGRIPVETYIADSAQEERIEDIVRRQVDEGRQVYYVCPLIEEKDDAVPDEEVLLSATELYNRLATDVFPDLRVGLMHGGMRAVDKDVVMSDFVTGTIQILVSTTVVEVGVDNPNASLMIIENADRFGLAQLHQLRGRIGRGAHRSVCILKSEKKEGLAMKRLTTLCKTSDGFEIARKDLELRGPGDFFGTRQHGIPDLKIANLYRDGDILAKVGEVWDRIYSEQTLLEDPRLEETFVAVFRKFGEEFFHPAL